MNTNVNSVACGLNAQRMVEPSLTDCPECGGHIHRGCPSWCDFQGAWFYDRPQGKSSTAIPGKKDDEAKPARRPQVTSPAPKTELKSTTESKSATCRQLIRRLVRPFRRGKTCAPVSSYSLFSPPEAVVLGTS
jgi:hypothetical protein